MAHHIKIRAKLLLSSIYLGQNLFISLLTRDFFFRSRFGGGGGRNGERGGGRNKKPSENDQLTGHFQSFFFF